MVRNEIKVSVLTFPLAAVSGYALRISGAFNATAKKARFAYYEDTFGFSIGPAEIVLRADGALRHVPATTERRRLSLLYRRATGHQL